MKMEEQKWNWITVSDAAKQLRLTAGRMRQLVAEGRIQVTRLNPRMNVITREEFERFREIERRPGRPSSNEN